MDIKRESLKQREQRISYQEAMGIRSPQSNGFICNFCRSEDLVFAHGHYHCPNCGNANLECCTGETK